MFVPLCVIEGDHLPGVIESVQETMKAPWVKKCRGYYRWGYRSGHPRTYIAVIFGRSGKGAGVRSRAGGSGTGGSGLRSRMDGDPAPRVVQLANREQGSIRPGVAMDSEAHGRERPAVWKKEQTITMIDIAREIWKRNPPKRVYMDARGLMRGE